MLLYFQDDGCGDESNALDSQFASVDDRIVRRVVILLALISLAFVVMVTIALRDRNAPTANVVSVQLPASGNAVATFLPDGQPVFVVTSWGGTTSVVDAVSTHRPYGVGYVIGWCPSSQTFDDPYHGSRWSSDGRYLLGPAPADLPTYTYRTLEGRITIDPNPTAPTTRSTTRLRIAGSYCRPKDLVEPTFASGAWRSPANAVAGGDGWVGVLGELRVTRDGAELCDPSGSCSNAVPVPSVKGNVFAETGRWLARIEGHDITDLTALP